MIKQTLVFVALCGLMGGSLLAHHSLAGVYDMKKDQSLTGSVEKVQFVNPHGSLTINVKETDGKLTAWVFTLGSATGLATRGIGKTGPNALHVGDMIKVTFLPALNGKPLGFLKTVTMPDGRVIVISMGQATD